MKKDFRNYTKVLYVVDMVKGFVSEGVMHDKYIEHTIKEQIKLIKKFKDENQSVAFIKDNHK
jgi:nicotinamidase-related amidase